MMTRNLTRTYCASFTLKYPNGHNAVGVFSEHVYIMSVERLEEDMLHFALDSMEEPVGTKCQIVADLGCHFDYDNAWLDAYVPMSCVQSIVFQPE